MKCCTTANFRSMPKIRRPWPTPIGVRGPAEVRRGPPGAVFLRKLDFGLSLASGVVWMSPDRPENSFGLCFGPNRQFSIHFGPNLTFLAPTGTLVGQNLGLAWLWTSPIAHGKPDSLSETYLSCLNSRHLSCLSSRHLSCLNSRHLSCLNRRHLSCLIRRRNSCRPPAGCCSTFC